MSTSIWEIIAETPWWFYLIVYGLIRVAIVTTKPRVIDAKNFYLLPIIYFFMTLVCVGVGIHLTANNLSYWLLACAAGIGLGWIQIRFQGIKAIKTSKQLYVPGSIFLFGFISLAVIAKYYIAYRFSTYDFPSLQDPTVARIIMALFGACTGLFIGKALYIVRLFKVGPFHIAA